MKLLIPIDQKGSLAAGLEAPNSWEPFVLQIRAIPAAIRPFIAENYNPATFKLADPVKRLQHPLNEEKVIAWLIAYHRQHTELEERTREAEQEQERRTREAALEVLGERKTTTRHEGVFVPATGIIHSYVFPVAAWPFQTPEDILNLPEAMRWQVELDEAKEAAKSAMMRLATQEHSLEATRRAETKQWIADWVKLHGTVSQQERLAEGLLPQSEIEEAILRQVAPVPHLPRNYSGDIRPVDELPPEAWNAWKAARERIAGVEWTQFLLLDGKNYAAKVAIAAGPLRLETIVVL